jgi:REP element-mobilizing transposase RayT
MGILDFKQFSERHRPHIHTPGKTLFVTFRLAGSIPKVTLREYKAKKDWLENELRRVRKLADGHETPKLKKQLEVVEQYKRDWFVKFEDILHKAQTGPMWMRDDRVAVKVAENLHRLDGDAYTLDAFCVMSNHVHAVFKPLLSEAELKESFDEDGHLIFLSEHPGLSKIMHSLKGRAARECNLVVSRTGQFWEHESFDHVIRQGKLMVTIRYVLNNPVKAGLVSNWREWRWNYCRGELIDDL